MAGDPSAPRRALAAVLVTGFAGIGGALLAGAAGWPAWVGFLGASGGTLTASAVLGRSAGHRRAPGSNVRDEAATRRAQEALALRRLWETARDFDAGGWGRRDLDALRLVSMNLTRQEPLNARVAERLRTASSAVRAGVTERLAAAAATADRKSVV